MKSLERSRAEAGMQSERHVRGQLRFMVPKLENHPHAVIANLISEIEAHLERIFDKEKSSGVIRYLSEAPLSSGK